MHGIDKHTACDSKLPDTFAALEENLQEKTHHYLVPILLVAATPGFYQHTNYFVAGCA
jgi:hypothetical protein